MKVGPSAKLGDGKGDGGAPMDTMLHGISNATQNVKQTLHPSYPRERGCSWSPYQFADEAPLTLLLVQLENKGEALMTHEARSNK